MTPTLTEQVLDDAEKGWMKQNQIESGVHDEEKGWKVRRQVLFPELKSQCQWKRFAFLSLYVECPEDE
jgi:hypothetical protein